MLLGDATDRSHDLCDRLSLCFHNFISSYPFCVIPSWVALILSHTSRVLSALLPLIHLLLVFYVSFRHVIFVCISSSLPVPLCCFRFNDISHAALPFQYSPHSYISSRHLWTHPSSPFPIFISSLSGSPSLHTYPFVSAPSPRLTRLGLYEGGMNQKR